MSAETDLRTLLIAAGAVTSVVSTRIYSDARAEGSSLPAIVYQRTGTEPVMTIHGTVAGEKAIIEIACIADLRATADSLAALISPALSGTPFNYVDRRSEYDPESDLFISALVYERWQ